MNYSFFPLAAVDMEPKDAPVSTNGACSGCATPANFLATLGCRIYHTSIDLYASTLCRRDANDESTEILQE
jgi:hypothetical protein